MKDNKNGEYFVYLPRQQKNFRTMERQSGKTVRKTFGKRDTRRHAGLCSIAFLSVLKATLILAVTGTFLFPGSTPAQPIHEIRATWLTTLGGLDWPQKKAVSNAGIAAQKKELTDLLDALKAANFNTVLLQTRLRGDVIYPSLVEPFAECLTGHTERNPQYDPLKFAVEECHKRGMELHAWIVCIPVGSRRQVNLHRNSVVKKRPELCKLFNGNWYLDPGNPGTANYLSRIVKEIVMNYDVDGIHLDYIRYPEEGDRFPDKDTFRKYGRGQDLRQWRRDNITRIVRRIHADVKASKPWVKVSSSPIGKYKDTSRYSSRGWNAYDVVYQDAQKWLAEGIHDMLFPMMYFQGNQFYPFALDWQENKHRRWIVPGLGIYFLHPDEQDWKLDEVIRQIHFSREIGLDGQAYFRNRFLLGNTKGLLDELKTHFYTHPALVPPMVWEDSVPPSPPSGTTLRFNGKSISMKWNPSTDNTKSNVYYRIYASNDYPVDAGNPQNLISARTDRCEYTYIPEFPWEQRIYWAVTSVDRFGNESTPVPFNRQDEYGLKIFENEMPEVPAGYTLIISDATGMEILRTRTPEKDMLSRLGRGFYRFSLLSPEGIVRPIGVTLR